MTGIHLQHSNFEVKKGSFCYKEARSDHLKKHMHLTKKPPVLESPEPSTLFL
jgi:hypothetical protein